MNNDYDNKFAEHDYVQARMMLSFLNTEVDALVRKNKLGLAENYKSSGRSLLCYLTTLNMEDVSLSQVDEELLLGYQQWLCDRGVRRNTQAFYMRNLHAVYNKAVRRGLAVGSSPFINVRTSITHTDKRAVTPELIRRISKFDVPAGLIRLGKDPGRKVFARMCRDLTFARDTFIFCFCARGLTFVDFAYLKRENMRNGSIVYERRKTGQCLQVAIQDKMHEFIEQYGNMRGPYLFPVLTSTDVCQAHRQYATALRRYNKQLNRLSQMLGMKTSLTSYVSRHSWATAAYHADIPLPHISEAMGHTSERTTRIYLKSLESSRIDMENRLLLNHIFKPSHR
ncbi:MAG: site-specific integrase [Bacteroidaceae bacterium]|nr:site-specific integrase [Bacteroidaceae bacterium]